MATLTTIFAGIAAAAGVAGTVNARKSAKDQAARAAAAADQARKDAAYQAQATAQAKNAANAAAATQDQAQANAETAAAQGAAATLALDQPNKPRRIVKQTFGLDDSGGVGGAGSIRV